MGVANWFETFCSNIRISAADIETITYRYKQITRRLNTDYWNSASETNHSLYVGSYGRDTEIFTSDIDMLFQLPYEIYKKFNSYTSNGQSALLQEVKNSISKTYPTTALKGDGQIIQVRFSDGINFEVLPAFINKDGKTFTFADSNNGGSWKTTDPRSEIDAIKSRNQTCNYNLKKLCRMMRSWKDAMNVPIKGLLIDTLAYQFIGDYAHRDKSYLYYDFMCRDFFEFMKNQDKDKTYWMAPGSYRWVLNSDNFRYKATMAYNRSVEAIEAEQNKKNDTAKSKWREIFGTRFPD